MRVCVLVCVAPPVVVVRGQWWQRYSCYLSIIISDCHNIFQVKMKISCSPCSMLIPPTFTSHSFNDNGWEIITKVNLSESLCVICICEREKHTVYARMNGLLSLWLHMSD